MKRLKYFLPLAIAILFDLGSAFAHPIYISICQIDFNPKTNALEISLKIFTDDLERGMENVGFEKMYLGEKNEHEKADEYVLQYVKSKFSLGANGNPACYTYVGKEVELDVCWIYLEVENITELKKIEVLSSLLTEIYSSQSNIVHVKNGKEIKSLILTKDKRKDVLRF